MDFTLLVAAADDVELEQVRKLRSEGTQVDDKFVVVWKARKVDCVHPEVSST